MKISDITSETQWRKHVANNCGKIAFAFPRIRYDQAIATLLIVRIKKHKTKITSEEIVALKRMPVAALMVAFEAPTLGKHLVHEEIPSSVASDICSLIKAKEGTVSNNKKISMNKIHSLLLQGGS